jgi:hypothetical protein
MATQIQGPAIVQRGRGRQVCTLADFTRHNDDLKLGPDGARWEVLSHDEVLALTADQKIVYRHNAVAKIPHLCASQGTWAFTIPEMDGIVLPQAVCFLYIKPPPMLAGLAAGGGVTLTYTGAQLLVGYTRARTVWQSHVWRRTHVNTAIEIAINFCL